MSDWYRIEAGFIEQLGHREHQWHPLMRGGGIVFVFLAVASTRRPVKEISTLLIVMVSMKLIWMARREGMPNGSWTHNAAGRPIVFSYKIREVRFRIYLHGPKFDCPQKCMCLVMSKSWASKYWVWVIHTEIKLKWISKWTNICLQHWTN